MARIHPTAIVEPGARIADDVAIGAYSCIGPDVELAPGVVVASHVVIDGRTSIGEGTEVYPFASLGHPPQHLGYRDEPTRLEIGRRNVIREHVTVNRGTKPGGGVTRVGDDGFFMTSAHVAHDCQVGNRVIMANNATLGGHVVVGDHVVIGGLAAIHQHVRIGDHAMIAGLAALVTDLVPFGVALGIRATLQGINAIGLKRRGFSRGEIQAIRRAFETLFFAPGHFAERKAAFLAAADPGSPVEQIRAFLRAPARRPLCQPSLGDRDIGDDA